MRIPPSVIVMSVVTAIPFGLGVRDTLKHKDVSAEEYDDLDFGDRRSARERRAELEEYEAERRREQLEREAKSEARIAQLDQLIGDKPAQMGSLFDGIVLGAGAGAFQPEDVRRRIERATRDGFMDVQFDADVKSLNGVEVLVSSDYDTVSACEKLDEKLTEKWGRSTNHAWIDPTTHQRASFDDDECTLRFDRYVDPADWVAQLPLTLVGTSVEKLKQTLDGNYDDSGDPAHIYWTAPGTGYGRGVTKYDAFFHNGKIRTVQATVDADFDSTLAVRDALSAKLKAQPKTDGDDYYQVYTWKRRVPVELETSDRNVFTVSIGNLWD
jgi:hypothetical protein